MDYRAIVAVVISVLFAVFFSAGVNAAEGLVVINGEPEPYEEFERMVLAEARQTFYHKSPTDEAAYIEFRRGVADQFVNRKLKLREARRRGLQSDNEYVRLELAKYEAQYGGTERWESEGEAMLDRLQVFFEEESLLQQIDAVFREIAEPDEEDIRAYYEQNIEKFTEPEQVRLSVIVLGVPAWSDSSVWDAARDEARLIASNITDRDSFADAAREYSTDQTASAGGDMGYVHAGILSGEMQQVVNSLEPGEMAARPVTVLEGVVLVRLEDRREPQVHKLDDVRKRATALWERDAATVAYEAAVARLRDESEIILDERYLEQLPN